MRSKFALLLAATSMMFPHPSMAANKEGEQVNYCSVIAQYAALGQMYFVDPAGTIAAKQGVSYSRQLELMKELPADWGGEALKWLKAGYEAAKETGDTDWKGTYIGMYEDCIGEHPKIKTSKDDQCLLNAYKSNNSVSKTFAAVSKCLGFDGRR